MHWSQGRELGDRAPQILFNPFFKLQFQPHPGRETTVPTFLSSILCHGTKTMTEMSVCVCVCVRDLEIGIFYKKILRFYSPRNPLFLTVEK